MLEQRIQQNFIDSADLKYQAAQALSKPIAQAVQAVLACVTSGGKVLACGNGGSAADSQHFAAEIVGRFERERPGMPAIALTVDTSAITAIANDYDFDRVFSKQVEALGQAGDVLLCMGIHGQLVYVSRRTSTVCVKLSGWPDAQNPVFLQRADDCRGAAQELDEQIRALGGKIDEGGSAARSTRLPGSGAA